MKFRWLFLLLHFISFAGIWAQESQIKQFKADSLQQRFSKDSAFIYRYKKIKHYANIDFRNAFVDNNFLSLVGLRIGVTIHNRHTVGIGGYILNEFSILKSNRVRTYEFEEVGYVTLIYEYILHDGKYLDIHFPFEIGYGAYAAKPVNSSSTEDIKSPMVPTGVGIKFLLMPSAWIGVKFGGGYRYVWEQNSPVGLDGLYFAIGVRIDIAKTYQDMRFMRLRKKYRHQLSAL